MIIVFYTDISLLESDVIERIFAFKDIIFVVYHCIIQSQFFLSWLLCLD